MNKLLTKEDRENSRKYQFESLLNAGYQKTEFLNLVIFTHPTDLLLKSFWGTAANHTDFYRYRTAEQMNAKVNILKATAESREKWKAEQKEKKSLQGVKITLSTLKKFIKDNEGKIHLKVLSRFDGMTDMVESVKDEFTLCNLGDDNGHNLGLCGLWLVGCSRDSFTAYNDNEFTGINIYNSCGSCVVATKKEKEKEAAENTNTVPPVGKIQIIDYSEKAIAVIGETKPIKEKLKELGGSFNPRLTCGAGWIFPKTKLQAIKDYLTASKEGEKTETKENAQAAEAEILHTSKESELPTLEYFKIIWHEGKHIEGATFENKIFTSWEDVQQAFLKLWQVNERGQGGGYTKVKCEIKFLGMEQQTDRIDITDKHFNGDFNPSLQHITEYLKDILQEDSTQLRHPEFEAAHPLNICDPESGQYKECVKEYLTQNTSPTIYTDLQDLRQEAKSGKLISLCNLSQLVNQ